MSFEVYQNADEDNSCHLLSEWESVLAMEEHFKTHEFELLLGASKYSVTNSKLRQMKFYIPGTLTGLGEKLDRV